MKWGGKLVCAGVGAAALGPLGAAAGALLGHWWDTWGLDLNEREEAFMPYFACLVAASTIGTQTAPKAKERALAIGRNGFNSTDPNRLNQLLTEAGNNLPTAQGCGQLFHGLDQGLRDTFACDIWSVL